MEDGRHDSGYTGAALWSRVRSPLELSFFLCLRLAPVRSACVVIFLLLRSFLNSANMSVDLSVAEPGMTRG